MRRDSASLKDIYRSGQLIVEFARGMSREDLELDIQKQSAILYQIQIVGEATKRLSREFREQHPELPWDDMAGMRDIIVHQYDRLDLDLIWRTIQENIPEMLEAFAVAMRSIIAPLLPVNPEEK